MRKSTEENIYSSWMVMRYDSNHTAVAILGIDYNATVVAQKESALEEEAEKSLASLKERALLSFIVAMLTTLVVGAMVFKQTLKKIKVERELIRQRMKQNFIQI